MRVLHLPSSTGGNAWNLSQAERKLGIESRVLVNDQNYFGFNADLRADWNKNKYTYPLKALRFYQKEIDNYDIFHFNFGRTLFNYQHTQLDMLDLNLLKRKKKAIVFTYQGTDARLAGYSLQHYDISFYQQLSETELNKEKQADARRINRMNKADKFADLIYTINPDLKNVLPKRTIFRPYTKLQLEEWEPIYSSYEKDELVFAHAPTSRSKKGTDEIINAIEMLRKAGKKVTFELIENVPNTEARRRLERADVVIDQIYIGWYGGLAVESMALGKPVVAYIRESDLIHIPKEMAKSIPIIRVTPQSLYNTLEDIIDHKEMLRGIARNSRNYVEKWHDSKKIAAGIIKDYQNILDKIKGNI